MMMRMRRKKTTTTTTTTTMMSKWVAAVSQSKTDYDLVGYE
jgi:hypothetical protein